METAKTITMALVDMVKSGGEYAIWGIVAYFGIQLLKTIIIGGFTWAITRLLVVHIQHYLMVRFMTRKDTIQLLSESCSNHIIKMIKDYQDNMTKSLLEFTKQAEELLGKSKKETK